MKIIDFCKKGNVVRFYLGDDDLTEYCGDDWDDAAYEHNAEQVYDEYIKMYADVSFPFDAIVTEPCDGESSSWSKDDMKDGLVPCIAVLFEHDDDFWDCSFNNVISNKKTVSIYFGDDVMVLDKLPECYVTYKGVKSKDGNKEIEDIPKSHINIGEAPYNVKVPIPNDKAGYTKTANIPYIPKTEEEAEAYQKEIYDYFKKIGLKVDSSENKEKEN